MAVTALASGSQTATITTEHTLAQSSTAGTFVLHVDTVNMAAGDVLELRVKWMAAAAGTARTTYFYTFSNAQPADDLIKVSVPVSTDLTDTGAVTFTLKQTVGTGRVFPWRVLKFA